MIQIPSELPSLVASATPGLVSILCRSMNRPELVDALRSVDAQTYPHLEIVLVDAAGKGVPVWRELGLRVPVREVSTQALWNRPAAANAALDAARGEFLLFLDEDDWIAADHVQTLVNCLQQNAALGVAYSSTQNTAPDGTLLDATLRIAFDPARLRRDNFIPIHSALFRHALVQAGCRFDTTLDIFEDWDFWLQCATQAPFQHVDVISAFYRQGGESNTSAQAPQTRYQPEHPIAKARARVFDKWRHQWSGNDLNQTLGTLDETPLVTQLHRDVARLNQSVLAEHEHTANLRQQQSLLLEHVQKLRAQLTQMDVQAQQQQSEIRGLHQQVNKLGHTVNKRTAELEGARTHVAQLSADLQLLLNSSSWKVTRPLRWARRKIDALRAGLQGARRGQSPLPQATSAPGNGAMAGQDATLPMTVAGQPGHVPVVVSQQGSELIHCNLDIPGPTQLEVPEVFAVQGWCCAPAGIAQIEALVDGVPQASFHTGVSRPDIAELFASMEDAFSSGFQQELTLDELPAGEHQLTLVITDKAGNRREISRSFMLFKNEDLYHTWYWRNMPDDAELQAQRELAGRLSEAPQFHVLVQAERDDDALFATLTSLREQVWPFFDIALVAARTPALEQLVANALPDTRRVRWWDSLASALTAPALQFGFVLFLHEGETLAPHALSEMGHAARQDDMQLIYSDHDRVSAQGTHAQPCFTPQWAPEHLTASNYIGGVYALRGERLALWQARSVESAAWRYACLLDTSLGLTRAQVHRCPLLLWSAPLDDAGDASLRAAETSVLRVHLARQAPGADVLELPHGLRAVQWPLPPVLPKVSIIIPTMGRLSLIQPCIESLLQITAWPNYEVVILDNGRGKYPDGIAWLREKPFTVVECNEPFNWARLNNIGVRHATGDLYLFLNDDIEITSPDWLEQLVRQALQPDVGAVGALLHYPNGALQHTGVLLVNYGGGGIHLLHKRMPGASIYRQLHATVREVSANTGACLLVSREKFAQIGGFDEELAVVGNDVDLCLRLLDAGYRNVWTPLCSLIHHESISRKTSVPKEDEQAMWRRWRHRFLAGDPWYHPNLSAEKGDFTLQASTLRGPLGSGTLAGHEAGTPAAGPVPLQPGVNLIGYTRAEMGIGEGARSDAKALNAANEPFGIVCYEAHNPSRMTDLSWEHKEMQAAPYDITLLHINPDHALQAISELPPAYFDGHYRIGYWAWELPELPADWEKAFVHFDEIWVPSHFVQEAVAMRSPIPVVRMPHAVEVEADATLDRASFGLPEDGFLFLAMFDTYSRPERKNPFGALRAFQKAFAPEDMSARLVLKVNNPTPDAMRRLREAIGAHRNILLLDKVYSRAQVNALIACCDCYVSLHRSEGFGFGPAEAMALGKAVMATAWSGNVDYMRPGNSIGIDYTLVTLPEDYGPYKKGQTWAEPDEAHATRAMQQLVADPALSRRLGENARATIAAEFAPLPVGRLMRKRLAAIRAIRASVLSGG
jgi:GT2 family glycosyltransferase/glycosyltransferase involved in cell wall biosynthesis